ncbi:hypothetical protein NDU88_002125 [Pleurodeles waltl]|uniref:Uncharacterized protein n=1 Tax=Pleurodeles waltl TaxID=8319 RepID=A0AAV7W3P2_PLEWA|nr:hypothetical protein NDU88_002125 [Pleurodeles waltl]
MSERDMCVARLASRTSGQTPRRLEANFVTSTHEHVCTYALRTATRAPATDLINRVCSGDSKEAIAGAELAQSQDGRAVAELHRPPNNPNIILC